jgi:hypothetical protein
MVFGDRGWRELGRSITALTTAKQERTAFMLVIDAVVMLEWRSMGD